MARLGLSGGWTGIPGTDPDVQNKVYQNSIDRDFQSRGESFTGIMGLGVQDCGIQEAMELIADRTIEYFGVSDTDITKLRCLLQRT